MMDTFNSSSLSVSSAVAVSSRLSATASCFIPSASLSAALGSPMDGTSSNHNVYPQTINDRPCHLSAIGEHHGRSDVFSTSGYSKATELSSEWTSGPWLYTTSPQHSFRPMPTTYSTLLAQQYQLEIASVDDVGGRQNTHWGSEFDLSSLSLSAELQDGGQNLAQTSLSAQKKKKKRQKRKPIVREFTDRQDPGNVIFRDNISQTDFPVELARKTLSELPNTLFLGYKSKALVDDDADSLRPSAPELQRCHLLDSTRHSRSSSSGRTLEKREPVHPQPSPVSVNSAAEGNGRTLTSSSSPTTTSQSAAPAPRLWSQLISSDAEFVKSDKLVKAPAEPLRQRSVSSKRRAKELSKLASDSQQMDSDRPWSSKSKERRDNRTTPSDAASKQPLQSHRQSDQTVNSGHRSTTTKSNVLSDNQIDCSPSAGRTTDLKKSQHDERTAKCEPKVSGAEAQANSEKQRGRRKKKKKEKENVVTGAEKTLYEPPPPAPLLDDVAEFPSLSTCEKTSVNVLAQSMPHLSTLNHHVAGGKWGEGISHHSSAESKHQLEPNSAIDLGKERATTGQQQTPSKPPQSGKKYQRPITLNLFDMLDKKSVNETATQLQQKSSRRGKKLVEDLRPSATDAIKSSKAAKELPKSKNAQRIVNKVSSSAPVKRGKEREKPKVRKPTSLRKIILREREVRRQKFLEDMKAGIIASSFSRYLSPSYLSESAAAVQGSRLSADDSEHGVIGQSPAEKRALLLASIHSRKFREYCSQVLNTEIDQCCTQLLQELVRFQDRLYHKDPLKAKIKRRYVLGLREVGKHLKARKVKCVIISPNLERVQSKGGLDEALHQIINECQSQGVPFVFALSRKALGKACKRQVPVSVVGIFNYEGADVYFHTLQDLTEKARQAYAEMVVTVEMELERELSDWHTTCGDDVENNPRRRRLSTSSYLSKAESEPAGCDFTDDESLVARGYHSEGELTPFSDAAVDEDDDRIERSDSHTVLLPSFANSTDSSDITLQSEGRPSHVPADPVATVDEGLGQDTDSSPLMELLVKNFRYYGGLATSDSANMKQ